DITNLSYGIYTYTIIDSLGCLFSDTASINQPDTINVISQTTNVSCANGNNGTATLNISGGTTPYTENWGTSNPLNLTAGIHTYIVNDDNGCNYTGSINITEPAPILVNYVTTNALCNGVNDGTAILNISGGVSPYNEDWGTNDPLALSAGIHAFIITDTNGCVLTDSVLISEPNQINVLVDTFSVSCSGFSDGSALLNISGGTLPYVENWGLNNPLALNVGTYNFTVTDSNNCTYQGQAIITEPNPISVNEFITDVSCFGLSDGVVLLQINGGTAPYNQDWLGDDPLALAQGNYSYTITDTNGCNLTNFVSINQPNELLVTSNINNVSCHGYSDGSINLNISGGTIPYNENWGGNNPLALVAGTYNFIVTDDNGCQFIDDAIVNQPNKILADYSVESPICEGEPSKIYINIINNTCNQYTIEINDQNSTTSYIIDSIGNVIIDNSQILLYPNQTINTTLLSITDIYGCISQINEDKNIIVNQLPILSMTLNDICESNPSFILDQASPTGGTYYINDMAMNVFDTDSLPTGDYIVRYDYTDPATSCNNTIEDIISLLPSPNASFVLGPQPTDLDNPNIRFFNTSEDFTNLIWNVGDNQIVEDETDFIFTYTDTGTYIAQLIIINEYNCSDTISKNLIINPVYSIFIPTSFTPNDDDMNEVFEPIINAAQ
ncbi:SprB repeat-containing protein, partial [bacterium]|nr:SprB repeat-containing protein [bacterium]